MGEDEKPKIIINIPREGNYIEILGHKIDGYNSFESFLEELKELKDVRDKNKELEKEVKQCKKYWEKRFVEYHKIIELMAEHISKTDIDEAVCKKMIPKSKFCKEYEKSECEKCVIDYFRKKAKGE